MAAPAVSGKLASRERFRDLLAQTPLAPNAGFRLDLAAYGRTLRG
jgi:hypothetical protein